MNDAMEKSGALFEGARRALEPTQEDIDRNHRALLAKIAGAASLAAASRFEAESAGAATKAVAAKSSFSLLALKIGTSAFLVGAVALTVSRVLPSSSRTTTPAAGTSALEVPPVSSDTPVAQQPSSALDVSELPSASNAATQDHSKRAIALPASSGVVRAPEESAVVSDEPLFEGSAPIHVSPLLAPELSLLQRMASAQRKGQSAEVSALAKEHERKFPNGVFREEREAIRSLSDCGAHVGSNEATLVRFESAYPKSSLGERVRKACAK